MQDEKIYTQPLTPVEVEFLITLTGGTSTATWGDTARYHGMSATAVETVFHKLETMRALSPRMGLTSACSHGIGAGCWHCCQRCNYDTHTCPGCALPLAHGTEACADCSRL